MMTRCLLGMIIKLYPYHVVDYYFTIKNFTIATTNLT